MTITATRVSAELPAGIRPKRGLVGGAGQFLQLLDSYAATFQVKNLAWGVLSADQSGRTTGTVSMALRRATPWQAAQLLAAMIRDGIECQNQVGGWLNANALRVLQG